ncbi:MAG: calcium/sodium antiporter [Lachnospiraceae bacterium]|nr:calcium/sodium antiporter [Lachnospiraceae bacterium]MBR3361530.1 calcium/sodium antiporter [Lachnospiraceae bacterium]MBR6357396.1 calcium/sodium antiporter [Lachnospiraceae bacterium]MDO4206742.1 calcium/sodium antiporter [Lachnospiraceae bacterium]
MAITIILFILGLVFLIFGGDWFVDGASGLAHRFKIPEIIVGATVVSIGTTLPEVMVSATSAAEGLGAMSYGNAIGSIICNTALILALSLAIRPAPVDRKSLRTPTIFFFVSAIFYMLVSYLTGRFDRWMGIVLLLIFVAYMILTVRQGFKNPDQNEPLEVKQWPLWRQILFLILGAAMIAVGARLLVDNGTKIAAMLGVPDSVIALTFVALGTSLPELVTAIVSLAKGHAALSLGNIVGANLFNIVLVCGTAITIRPFNVPVDKVFLGQNASFIVDLPLMFLVMAFVTIPALIRGKLSRFQGIALLVVYVAYVTFQFFG